MYQIQQYTYNKAKLLGVVVKPSNKPNKKIDVYKNNIYLFSVGDSRYKDYPTYLLINKKIADERRRLYRIRHKNDRNIKNSPGFYASELLW